HTRIGVHATLREVAAARAVEVSRRPAEGSISACSTRAMKRAERRPPHVSRAGPPGHALARVLVNARGRKGAGRLARSSRVPHSGVAKIRIASTKGIRAAQAADAITATSCNQLHVTR